jgi:hypothetical protein
MFRVALLDHPRRQPRYLPRHADHCCCGRVGSWPPRKVSIARPTTWSKSNWYARERLIQHLKRRSQRGFEFPKGRTIFQWFEAQGLIVLSGCKAHVNVRGKSFLESRTRSIRTSGSGRGRRAALCHLPLLLDRLNKCLAISGLFQNRDSEGAARSSFRQPTTLQGRASRGSRAASQFRVDR